MTEALALEQLAKRKKAWEAGNASDAETAIRKLGIQPDSCLDHLDTDFKSLRVLLISETGTTGMYGPWSEKSRMYLALATVGYTPKQKGGGSFGYGKAGLINGSATRTVIAYSCFRERDDDPGVTRRLFGMTYWGEHTVDGVAYPGFGRFGSREHDSTRPFENNEADAVAESLYIPRRNHQDPNGIGTTLLLVDPTVQPEDLLRAVERNWWPALEESELDFCVEIKTPEGDRLVPRPKKNPVLRSFIRAYEVATVPQDNKRPDEYFGQTRSPGKGRLGLVADLENWSYPGSSGTVHDIEDRSLVALMRKPRMVIEYYKVGRASTRPLVRGVFVADNEIDDALRKTEPKGHDCWQTQPGKETDEVSTLVARDVLKKISSKVGVFRSKLKPPPRPQDKIVLSFFNRMMRRILQDETGFGPPPTGSRPFKISVTPECKAVGDDQVRVSGRAELGLSDDSEHSRCQVLVRLRCILEEDGGTGTELNLRITPPPGFMHSEGRGFTGELKKEAAATFEFVSDSYPALWTTRFIAAAEFENSSA